jgi:hypothetical protein
LKLMNPYRAGLECIDSVDFKNVKRSFWNTEDFGIFCSKSSFFSEQFCNLKW